MKKSLLLAVLLGLEACSFQGSFNGVIGKFAESRKRATTFDAAKNGYEQNIEQAKDAQFQTIRDFRDQPWLFQKYAPAMQQMQSELLGAIASADSIGRERGKEDGRVEGFLKKLIALFQDTYAHYMMMGTQNTTCDNQTPLEGVPDLVKGLRFPENGHQRADLDKFSQSLYQINVRLLTVINAQIPNQPPNFQEKVMARYQEIHQRLAVVLHRTLAKYLNSKNDPGYADWSRVRSIDAFLFMYTAALGPMLDAVYTDALESWSETAAAGLRAFGGQTDCALQSLIPRWAEQLYDHAMQLDLEKNKKGLERKLRSMLEHRTIEIRGDTLTADDVISRSQINMDVKMDIITILKLRLKHTQIKVKFNHEQNEIIVVAPAKPSILEVVHFDYVVRAIDVSIDDPCGIGNLSQMGIKGVSRAELERIFRQHRIPIKKNPISQDAFEMETVMKSVKKDLQKYFEAYTLLLIGSTYRVKFEMDGSEEMIINLNNKHNSNQGTRTSP
ncbi:MAG: hypothetical protein JNJ57_00995 [Saprospiraceae bacterium]|nr:hypothetical protein [Saprospiraceae bacterium]